MSSGPASLAAEAVARRSYGKLVAFLASRSGDVQAANLAYERAIGLESDPAVRRYLQQRQAAISDRK